MNKWIDGDKLADSIHAKLCEGLLCDECSMCLEDGGCKVEQWLDEEPSIELVRCKDCKHQYNGVCEHPRAELGDTLAVEPDDFCSYGEPKDEPQTDCYDCVHWDYPREVCCKGGGCEFKERSE